MVRPVYKLAAPKVKVPEPSFVSEVVDPSLITPFIEPVLEFVMLIFPVTFMAPAFNVLLVTLNELNLLVEASKVIPEIIALLSIPATPVPVSFSVAVVAVAENA